MRTIIAGRILFSGIVVFCKAVLPASYIGRQFDNFLRIKDTQASKCAIISRPTVTSLITNPFNLLVSLTRFILSTYAYIGVPFILYTITRHRLTLFHARKYSFSEFFYVTIAESTLRFVQLNFTVYLSTIRPAALYISIFLMLAANNVTISDILRWVPDPILVLWFATAGAISFPFFLFPDMNVIIDMWLIADSFRGFLSSCFSCYRYIQFSMHQVHRSVKTRWDRRYQHNLLERFEYLYMDSRNENEMRINFQTFMSARRGTLHGTPQFAPNTQTRRDRPDISKSPSTPNVTMFTCDLNRASVTLSIRRSCSFPSLVTIGNETEVNNVCTNSYLHETGIQLANMVLDSPFHPEVISLISKHYSRISIYDNSAPTSNTNFQSMPTEEHLFSLLNTENVRIVSISYKHTRIGNSNPLEVSNDRRRVLNCLQQVCKTLRIQKILFWCDLVYPSPDCIISPESRQIPWAKQGIDPYLLVPAIRMISDEQMEEIGKSFWMSVERVASIVSAGFITYYETHRKLLLESRDTNRSEMMPHHCAPFDDVKFFIGSVICSPILYYKKARYESDKDMILKYGIENALAKFEYFEYIDNTESETAMGSRKIRIDDRHLGEFLKMITVSVFASRSLRRTLDRSTEYFQNWNGMASFFPALNVLNDEQRVILEEEIRGTMKIKRLGENIVYAFSQHGYIDRLTDVICQPLQGSSWCNTLVVTVHNFLEGDNEVTGSVRKFRIASEEEEEDLRHLPENLYKTVNFT